MLNFTELYYKTVDNLFSFGAKLTSDRELIKDCIQDVFVKLYTKREELDSIVNIESYLHVSLRNRINDEFRKSSHINDSEVDSNSIKDLCDDADLESVENAEAENERTNAVHKFLKCLSPRQQQIINLYYIEQRKYDDICQIMGINYQSVRNLMHRSLMRLRFLAAKSVAV